MIRDKKIFDDEIDLISYARIILKRKVTILFFFTFAMVVLTYLIYVTPLIYLAESEIFVGRITNPLMTVADAVSLLRKNRASVISNLSSRAPINENDLLLMLSCKKVELREVSPEAYLQVVVKDKDSQQAIDISNAISAMLVDEGKKIYNRERSLGSQRLKEYEARLALLEEQLALLETVLLRKKRGPYVTFLKEIKDFYLMKYDPLVNETAALREKLVRSQDFWISKKAVFTKNMDKLSFNQILVILSLGVIFGIVFVFFQEFWSNNFKG